jgi:ELWxxDGT repeat protein
MAKNLIFFNGPASDLEPSLWETDGTTAGTFMITGINGAFGNGDGINPLYITAYNGGLLFNGTDTSSKFGLWMSNGTAAGTTEIGGIGSAGITNANPQGLDPRYMYAYNGKVLFRGAAGLAGNAKYGLWITDGTAGGTTEIGGNLNAGINGVFSGGFLPSDPDFTFFNNKVLFSARDQFNQQGLWVTDGTANGTTELGPISGAAFSSADFPAHPQLDIQPQYMAVLGNKVIFDGVDQTDTPGSLWVTDGTINGTTEIGGQGNQGVAGSPFTDPANDLPFGMQPNDITAFNAIGKVIFAAYDNTSNGGGHYVPTDALWLSDGTVGGTVEIGGLGNAGIANANSAANGGIFWSGSVGYPDFFAYKNLVLFAGRDSQGHIGLWETDGTAGGTVEVGGLGNAGIKDSSNVAGGLHFVDASPDFTYYKGKALFYGYDSNGLAKLWVTDGTAGGTQELVTPSLSLGSPNVVLGPNFTALGTPLHTDFNDDFDSDVLWRNGSSGAWAWSDIHNNLAWNPLGSSSSTAWKVVGTGDLSGDGYSDAVWRNDTTGEWAWSDIHNNLAWNSLGTSLTAWNVVGTGDFNDDHAFDVLWRNNTTGDWAWSDVHDGNAWHAIGGSQASYNVVGTGDFNADGTTDVLWRDNSSGLWGWSDIKNNTWHDLGSSLTTWNIVGVGDFNNDGFDDVLWRNNTSGAWAWSDIHNNEAWNPLQNSSLTAWNIVGVGDYNGDGYSDALWRNNTSGEWAWSDIHNSLAWHQSPGGSLTSWNIVA